MPRNGSGTYSLVSGNPVSTGTTIQSTWANNTLSDIASALTASIAIDGQTPPTNNLPMGANKHTNVAVASATTDYLRADQEQNSSLQYLTSVSGTNTITASASIAPAAYAAGQTFRFVASATNTGAVTLNVNGLGAKAVTKQGTTALVAGDIVSGRVVNVTYDGTQFQMVAVPNTLALTSLGVSGPSVISQFNSTDNVNVIQVSQASTIGGFIGADSGNLLLANSSGSEILRITSTGVNANTKPSYFCRAWVNFDGASPGSGRGSQNVTSVTRTGLGDYTVNFSTAIADANYATVVTSTSNSGANSGYYGGIYPGGTYTASAVRVGIHQSGVGFAVDPAVVCVAVFR